MSIVYSEVEFRYKMSPSASGIKWHKYKVWTVGSGRCLKAKRKSVAQGMDRHYCRVFDSSCGVRVHWHWPMYIWGHKAMSMSSSPLQRLRRRGCRHLLERNWHLEVGFVLLCFINISSSREFQLKVTPSVHTTIRSSRAGGHTWEGGRNTARMNRRSRPPVTGPVSWHITCTSGWRRPGERTLYDPLSRPHHCHQDCRCSPMPPGFSQTAGEGEDVSLAPTRPSASQEVSQVGWVGAGLAQGAEVQEEGWDISQVATVKEVKMPVWRGGGSRFINSIWPVTHKHIIEFW